MVKSGWLMILSIISANEILVQLGIFQLSCTLYLDEKTGLNLFQPVFGGSKNFHFGPKPETGYSRNG